jgi:hypothetical protein
MVISVCICVSCRKEKTRMIVIYSLYTCNTEKKKKTDEYIYPNKALFEQA